MFSTSSEYIHEYDIYDSLVEYILESQRKMEIACQEVTLFEHDMKMKDFFEGVNEKNGQAVAQKKEGLVTRLGNFILSIIKRIGELLTRITGVFTNRGKQMEEDSQILNSMLKQHPELADQIVNGINKEWFTIKDVTQFKNDALGLINMLNTNRISHQSFLDKFRDKCAEFSRKNKPIVDGISTAKTIVGAPHDFMKIMKDTKSDLQDLTHGLERFRDTINKNYAEHDQNYVSSVTNAIGQAIGLTTKECKDREEKTGKFAEFLHKIANSKVGTILRADDKSRFDRHYKATMKRYNSQYSDSDRSKASSQQKAVSSLIERYKRDPRFAEYQTSFRKDMDAAASDEASRLHKEADSKNAGQTLVTEIVNKLIKQPEFSGLSTKDVRNMVNRRFREFFNLEQPQSQNNKQGKGKNNP